MLVNGKASAQAREVSVVCTGIPSPGWSRKLHPDQEPTFEGNDGLDLRDVSFCILTCLPLPRNSLEKHGSPSIRWKSGDAALGLTNRTAAPLRSTYCEGANRFGKMRKTTPRGQRRFASRDTTARCASQSVCRIRVPPTVAQASSPRTAGRFLCGV